MREQRIVLSQRVAYAHSIMRSPDDVWNVMKDVYQRLGFPVSRFDPTTRSIAADGFPVRRRLGGESVSRYVDCGRTVAGPMRRGEAVTDRRVVGVGQEVDVRITGNAQTSVGRMLFATLPEG